MLRKKYDRSPSFRLGNKKIHPSNVRDVGSCSCECYNAQDVFVGDPWYGDDAGQYSNMAGQPMNAPATCFCNNYCGQSHDGAFCGSLWDYNQDGIYTWQPPTGFNPASHHDGPCWYNVDTSGTGTGANQPGNWPVPTNPFQPRDIPTQQKRTGGHTKISNPNTMAACPDCCYDPGECGWECLDGICIGSFSDCNGASCYLEGTNCGAGSGVDCVPYCNACPPSGWHIMSYSCTCDHPCENCPGGDQSPPGPPGYYVPFVPREINPHLKPGTDMQKGGMVCPNGVTDVDEFGNNIC